MVILDTDHLSIFDQDTLAGFNLGLRLSTLSNDDIAVTIITYEEQMRGWLTYVAKAKSPVQQVEAYRKLHRHIEQYRKIPLLDYDTQAAVEFERLKLAGIRIGTMDLKIASIALANNAMVLTRNLQHFEKVPGLRVEDWSV